MLSIGFLIQMKQNSTSMPKIKTVRTLYCFLVIVAVVVSFFLFLDYNHHSTLFSSIILLKGGLHYIVQLIMGTYLFANSC